MVCDASQEFTGFQLTAAEIAFIGEEELIEIRPKIMLGMLHFISGDYGPIRENEFVKIPLWLALKMRRAQHCRIVMPSWMRVANLELLVAEEEQQDGNFSNLPFNYIQIADAILNVTDSEEIPQPSRVRLLIQKLRELRYSKIQHGLSTINGGPVNLNNIAHMEINEIRPFLLNTLYAFTKINIAERIQIDIASNMQHYSSSQNYMTDSKDEKYKKVEFDPLRAFNTSILPSIMSDSLSQTFHSPVDELESFEQLLKRP